MLLHGLTPEGRGEALLDATEFACRLLGQNREEVLRRHPEELLHFSDEKGFEESLRAICERGFATAQASLALGAGTPFPVDLRGTLLRLGDRQAVLWTINPDWEGDREASATEEVFAGVAYRLASVSNPREAALAILEAADRLFGWDAALLNLYPDDRNDTYSILNYDTINGVRQEFHPVRPHAPISRVGRLVLEEGAQLFHFDENDPRQIELGFEQFGEEDQLSRSLMFVPIRQGMRNFGVLSVQSYAPNAYRQEDLERLQVLADHCSGALERIMAQDSFHKQVRMTNQFSDLGKKLAAANTPREAALVVLSSAEALCGWDACSVDVFGQGTGALLNVVALEIDTDGKRAPRSGTALKTVPQGPLRRVLDDPSRFLSETDLEARLDLESVLPHGIASGRKSVLVAPIASGERLVGILCVQSRREGAYTAEHLRLLQALGGHCAGALRRTFAEHELVLAEELERSLSLLQATLEATTDGILMVDPQGQLVTYNRNWVDLFRVDQDNLIAPGKDAILDIVAEALEDPDTYRERVRELRRERRRESFDVLRLLDGRIVECYSRLRESLGSNTASPDVLGRVWSFRDVTLRHHAEEALARSEAIYREAIENAEGVPYRMHYAAETYEFMGRGIETLLGWPVRTITKQRMSDIIVSEAIADPDAARVHSNPREYAKAFRSGRYDKYRMDLRVRTADGSEKWVADFAVALRDPETCQTIGTIGILQDITKRKDLEEQARLRHERLSHAEKLVALGTLVSGVAHEINNPNHFIMLNLPVLQEAWTGVLPILDQYYEEDGDFLVGGLSYHELREEVPRLFSAIMEGSRRIRDIVRELGDFARPAHEGTRIPVDINAVVTSGLVLLQNLIKNSTNRFETVLGKDLPRIAGSPQRLEQVVINLIQNACQALVSKDQKVRVETSYDRATETVLLTVTDEGRGIPPHVLKQVEVPFFTTKRDTGGTGLGLSITSTIIKEHGGILEFQSCEGLGTIAMVALPIRPMLAQGSKEAYSHGT